MNSPPRSSSSAGTATSALAGKYTVAEYAHEDFTAGNGFDLGVYFGMPAGAYVIGSYYMQDGAAVIIEPGETIQVDDMGDGVYSISGSGYSFLCAPEGFVPGGGEVYDMTETVAQDCTLEDGQTLVEDVESHTFVLKKGEEFIAQMKLIRSVGATDFAGDYTVKEYAHEDFSAGNGFDLGVYFGMDPGAYVIGSYYMSDGAVVIVEPGETISVSAAGENTWKFTGSDWEFTGKLQGGTPDPGPGPGPGPEDNFDYTPGAAYNSNANLWKSVDAAQAVNYFMYMNIAQDWSVAKYDNVGGAECPYAEFQQSTYKLTFEDQTFDRWQNQFYIYPEYGYFIPLSADKTYKFSVTLQSTESFGAFFKLVQYNADNVPKYEGAAIWEPEGYPNNVVFEAGKPVVLEHEFTGVECENINLIFDFGGNPAGTVVYIKDITIVEQGGEPGPGEEPVELSEFLSLTDYSIYNMPMVGIELGTPGFYYQPADWVSTWAPTYPVAGNFLKLEVYSEDGQVAPGTYVPSANNGTVNAGEFNLGAESWGGAGGTVWYTVSDGAATYELITDGTVTIAKDGDVYTIDIVSSTVTARYVGKLSAGGDTPGGETAITIDGDMSDWAGIEAGLSSEEGPYLEFKAANDDEFIYLYSKRTWHDGLWKDSSGGYYYFEFDTDNDSSTGTTDVNGNTGFGVEAWMYLYLFTGTAAAPTFASNPAGSGYPSSAVIENILSAGFTDMTNIETEVRIPLANIGVAKGQTIKIYTWGNKSAGNLKGEDSYLLYTLK